MNKFNNIKRGVSPSSSIRPPSPSIRTNQHHIPVRPSSRSNIAPPNQLNNDIDRELLSQSADFDGPDIEIQSILSSAAQSSIHDLVLAQKQDRYLSSVLPSTSNDGDVEDEENIENDVEIAITDAESDRTDLTSFACYMQTAIIDNKNLSSDTTNQEITEMLSNMSSQSLVYFMENIMKEVEKRKDTANAIQNGVTIAGRAGLEYTINPNPSTNIRRPSFEKVERKSSPSLYKKNNTKITKFDGKGTVPIKKTNNSIILSRPTVQRISYNNNNNNNNNKSNKLNAWTSYKGKKNNAPLKGATVSNNAHEESRECDFDEELREINVSPTLRVSFDGLTINEKNKIQQRVNNRHGAAHPHEKMFKTGPRYNPSPPNTQKVKENIFTEAMKLFSFKKPKISKEKASQEGEEDLIIVEAIKVKNLRCVNILSDDESSNGQSSFSISASTAFDDRSAGSSTRLSIK